MLDQIRRDIQNRLDELLSEVDRLRRALAALASRDGSSSSVEPEVTAPAPSRKAPARKSASKTAASNGARTAPGATKAAILAALAASEDPMTAGEIAEATGLGRATISTTLSRLARSGEVTKAERGYEVKAAA
ncbi:MAG: helix-turn-helix domain-containing protein [Solirubrobacteraceae bacterium]